MTETLTPFTATRGRRQSALTLLEDALGQSDLRPQFERLLEDHETRRP